ncbi:MAG: DUF2330 domain-containing protein [Armatimonadetes bacterium]|nr:DUF2330 domain-containing protein [Armatimonadota bacterium]
MVFRQVAVAFSLHAAVNACPCASVSSGPLVRLTGESALIAFDARTSVEHFVRRAVFDSQAKDFGFLVPVPSRPTIAEVDDETLPDLADFIRPFLPNPTASGPASRSRGGAGGAGRPVEVVETATIGPLTATVVRSTDSSGLAKWLRANGYVTPEDVDRYLSAYTSRHWYFVALKVTSPETRVQTVTLRISFSTKVPIYPYRTPRSQWGGATRRPLSLFVLSEYRPDARFLATQKSWSDPLCETEFSGLAVDSLAKRLHVRPDGLPESGVLSHYRIEGGTSDYAEDLGFRSGPFDDVSAL